MATNFYEILGVKQSSSLSAITDAYAAQREILQGLLDNGVISASSDLLTIEAAFATLSDPVRRGKYDDKLATSLYKQAPLKKLRFKSIEPISGAALVWVLMAAVAFFFLVKHEGGDHFGSMFIAFWGVLGGVAFQLRMGGVKAVGGGFIVALIATGLFTSSAHRSPAHRAQDRAQEQVKATAAVNCEHMVKKVLKAPSTADFASLWEQSIGESRDGTWHVAGHVDAQNSFGAKLRSTYTCKMQISGDAVTVKELVFDGKTIFSRD